MCVTYTLHSFVVSRLLLGAYFQACAVRQCPPSRLVKGLTDPPNVNCFRAPKGSTSGAKTETADGAGKLYVADTDNQAIRQGAVATLKISSVGDQVVLAWPLGLLLEATHATGPWTTILTRNFMDAKPFSSFFASQVA